MNKPVIALDIDDVLVDTATHLLGSYNKTYGTKLTRSDYYSKDPVVHGVEHFNEAAKRFEKYMRTEAYSKAEPIPEAVQAIKYLSRYYDFIGVTSRPEYVAEATGKWLEKHFGVLKAVFTSFIMGATTHQGTVLSKTEVCQDIGATYMIEDHLHHALPVSASGVTVLLFDQLWNQKDDLPDNVIRVQNWQEIREYLDNERR